MRQRIVDDEAAHLHDGHRDLRLLRERDLQPGSDLSVESVRQPGLRKRRRRRHGCRRGSGRRRHGAWYRRGGRYHARHRRDDPRHRRDDPGTGGAANINLIKNGDFSAGKEYWDLTPQAGEAYSEDYTGGQYCVLNPSTNLYLSFSLGFPPTPSDAFVITPGATYTLSYQASGTYLTMQPTVQVKIGHVETPYTELYSTTDVVSINAISSPQTFTHTIVSAAGDTEAGLVFNGTLDYYSEICFDNVVLVKN